MLGMCMLSYFESRLKIVLDKLLHERHVSPEVKDDYYMNQIDKFSIDFNKDKSIPKKVFLKNRQEWKKTIKSNFYYSLGNN